MLLEFLPPGRSWVQRRAGVSSQGSVVGWLCERELTWPCCLLGDPVGLVFSVFPHQCQESKEVQFPFQGRDLAGFTDTQSILFCP